MSLRIQHTAPCPTDFGSVDFAPLLTLACIPRVVQRPDPREPNAMFLHGDMGQLRHRGLAKTNPKGNKMKTHTRKEETGPS